ncbi:MAG: hypothetical protein SGBAC_004183 [Bacillariaceae sp.]
MSQHQNQQSRLQYKELVVHCRRLPYDVYVGRPSRGAPAGDLCTWGNPFNMKNQSQDERNRVIREYRCWLVSQPDLVVKAQRELKGKVLACWCSPKLCHGHVLAEVANSSQCAVGSEEKEEEEKEVAKIGALDEADFPALGLATTRKPPTAAKKSKPLQTQSKTVTTPTKMEEIRSATDENRQTKTQ